MLVQMITASEYCDLECYTSLSHGLYLVNWGLCQLRGLFYKMGKTVSYGMMLEQVKGRLVLHSGA